MPEGAAGGPAVLYRTTVHPHRIKWDHEVTVVAIDLREVELRLVAGTQEPVSPGVPAERRPGLVPQADQADLVAVFNGGFLTRHGQLGMKVDGDTFLPPRPDACTVAIYGDGAVRVAPWTLLQATEKAISAYRQTPPCLVSGGALHPAIDDSVRPRLWSAAENGDTEIRRSALGVSASGRALFYGLGEWVTARELAEAMQAAGAVDAAQLDINWSYTKFLFFGRPSPGAPLEVVSTLIPKIKHTRKGHVGTPAERDFFYLKRRARGAAPRQ
jgi:hypothetical protein